MLQRIRDNASGPVAYVVVALIALVFGVWGIGSYFTPSSDPVVASVGGTNITHNQLQQAFNQRYARLRQMMGKNFDPSMVPPDKLRHAVLQSMISEAVLDQYATTAGYTVTSANLLAELRSDPQFQKNGQFSAKRYRALLAQAGIAPARYEASLRKNIKSQLVHSEVAGSAFATPVEVDQAYRLVNQQREVSYLTFDPADYKNQVKVTDAEVKTYYQAHPHRFMRPKRVKLSYVSLDRKSAASAAPTQKALHKIYDKNKARLGTPEKRAAEEVKVPIHKNDDATARNAIQAVDSALKSGKDLKAAAQTSNSAEYRHMDASAQDSLPDAVGKALFGLKKGQVSSPIRGDGAWYLVKLDSITPAQTPPFNDPQMQSQLRAIATAEQERQAYKEKSSKMDDLAYQAPNDLKILASKLNLQIQHSGWISKDQGAGIGQYDAVRKAAFSDSVLKDKLNSTVISIGDNRKVVLRVDDVEPAQRKPFDAVKSDIHDLLVRQKASSKAQDAAQQALATLDKSGKALSSMDALAKKDSSAEIHSLGYIGRSSKSADPRILDTVFSLPAPTGKKPSYAITPTAKGPIALVAVEGVREDSDAKGNNAESQRQQFAQRQQRYIGALEYAALSNYLQSQADVTIHQDQLQ